jgi:hypothetical protein
MLLMEVDMNNIPEYDEDKKSVLQLSLLVDDY